MSSTTTDDLALLHAVAETAGLHLVSANRVSAEATAGGITVGFEATLGDDTGGEIRRLIYVETAPTDHDRDGVLRFRDDDGDERAVWVYPNDPALPALADAVVPARATTLLREVAELELDANALELEVLAYRPGKRAVVRCRAGDTTVYLKVVHPDVARTLAERHGAWRSRGVPVPRAYGWSPRGVIALEQAAGAPALDALTTATDPADPERLLDAIDRARELVARLVDTPDTAIGSTPARASLARRISWYARRVRRLAPELGDRLGALTTRIEDAVRGATSSVTIHGDLHLGQVFVHPHDPATVTSLIDIDTAGIGDPADDDAALWAHLIASARFARDRGDTERARTAEVLAAHARTRWAAGPDTAYTARVAAIAATHLLGHALTEVLTPAEAVQIAEELLADPEDENRLSKTS
ncbi:MULTISPECIES: aminoglycoside phosphotransferase family protein [unclassified Salinibacterium]|uniref:phosphotransferase family protein n=1 Tax=unclassified Salinibacterium TaxID=2632331 RepID=UPI0014210597|nr:MULTISPECIES: aminoglycoside phosphotransferase family protein [unclassified Salinibacterium]